MEYIQSTLLNLVQQTAFLNLTFGNMIMIFVAFIFLYLAIKKGFEPLLLVPISFGMLLVNIYPDIMLSIEDSSNGVGGLLHYFYLLDEWSILPSLIFMGVGAMTDFGPLIANPKSFLLGAAAQFGIYAAYFLAIFMGFNDKAAAAISIIGGADGPTSIFLAGKLGQTEFMGPIAVAAYSYMALVPIIHLNLVQQTAFLNLTFGNMIMIFVAFIFLYLAIKKGFEPLLLVPISFGMLLVNIYPDIMLSIEDSSNGVGGLLHYFYLLDEWSILPSLIFMGVGAMTDFGPLIANPKSFLLGAAAQFGIYAAYFLAIFMGFNDKAAAAISIIGGADGPTSIFLAGKLGQTEFMGPIAVAAYSYMALVPIIQPPIMKLLTTEEERKIKMEQLRPVSKLEKILFPIIVTVVVCLILPTTAPLVGMLMVGNLFRESGVVKQLQETASNALMYIVVIVLGLSVGATTSAEAFLKMTTIKIVILGLVAFAFGTAAGVIFGKIMCKVTGGKVNPLIGSAGVSAVPMAARVSQKVGSEADPTNFLLMHAMGPNVAGVIGTAVAAGTFMAIFGIQ